MSMFADDCNDEEGERGDPQIAQVKSPSLRECMAAGIYSRYTTIDRNRIHTSYNRKTDLAGKSLPLEKRRLTARRSTGKTTRNLLMKMETKKRGRTRMNRRIE